MSQRTGMFFDIITDYKDKGTKAAIKDLNSLSGDRKSTRLNSSHIPLSRMPSSA